jgi:hypothetical protein
MKKEFYLPLSGVFSCFLLFPVFLFSQVKSGTRPEAVSKPVQADVKFGALAIDRGNGICFGWAADCVSLAEAEKKALENCSRKGGRCTIVLSYSGTGCAVYRFITGNVGMGYGWGLARTKEEADTRAKKECAERSYGLPAPNMVSSCNSANSGDLKLIYDAHDEIKSLQPGTITNY